MTLEVSILLSVGRHPVSLRPRPAAHDRRALELAMGLGGAARLQLVHVGVPSEPALRGYLGMGPAEICVLDCPADGDPLPALIEHLRAHRPHLVLAGIAAEQGEGSGLVPYLVAASLGAAIMPDIVALSRKGGGASLIQAAPGGRRRRLAAPWPIVATVGHAGPEPRPAAFAQARRGIIRVLPAPCPTDDGRADWTIGPARARPKRLRPMADLSAAARLDAISGTGAGRGDLLVGIPPEEAAEAIYAYLVGEGIIVSGAGKG